MGDTEHLRGGKGPRPGGTLLGLGSAPDGSTQGTAGEDQLPALGERYTALRELGRGGMGTVYLVEHAELGRTFAVKVLLPELSANAQLVERLRREARAASKIRHPGIVDVTDFGSTDDGRAFVVMEHLEGEDLADRLIRDGALDQEEATEVALAVCRALDAAHAEGIIHRDIKPENIILAEGMPEGERVKVVDFGLALSPEDEKSRLTLHGATYGTPDYMAPEQCTGKGVSEASDIYALGSVLYQMLTGSPPFVEDSAVETMARKLHEAPEPPSERDASAEIHPDLEGVVEVALKTASWERYGSMAEMAEALEGALTAIRSGECRSADGVGPAGDAPLEDDDSGAVSRGRGPLLRIAAAVGLVALGALAAILVVSLSGGGRGGGAERSASGAAVVGPAPVEPGTSPDGAAETAGDAGLDAAAALSDASDAGELSIDSSPRVVLAPPLRRDGGSSTGAAADSARGRDREGAKRLVAEGRVALRRRDLASARRAFTEAARLDGGNPSAQGGLGTVAFEQGHYGAAARHLERALRSRPRSTRYRLLLGSVYLRQGSRDRAAAEWQRVLQIDPDNAAARRSLAAIGRSPR